MSAANVLVINCGSSSLKFALVDIGSGNVLSSGLAERLQTEQARLKLNHAADAELPGATHEQALDRILQELGHVEIRAVGHRVVHGGEAFSESVLIDDAVIDQIRRCSELAPLHNPANLTGIEVTRRRFSELPQVAVFDTAFHQSLPRKAYLYAVPYEFYERYQTRRYGFHGTSHAFVAREAARYLGAPLEQLQLITAHLGNGCSACAVKHGRSVDTTMGLTPLEGLVMGTRSGDVDPNLHEYLAGRTGQNLAQITAALNRQSGLLGLSGSSNDMRVLESKASEGDERAGLAIDVFCYRLAKAILGLAAGLERLDALVFTGGIGENSAQVRKLTLSQLAILQPELDEERNRTHGAAAQGRISAASSRLTALVVKTNEELMIARETARVAQARAGEQS